MLRLPTKERMAERDSLLPGGRAIFPICLQFLFTKNTMQHVIALECNIGRIKLSDGISGCWISGLAAATPWVLHHNKAYSQAETGQQDAVTVFIQFVEGMCGTANEPACLWLTRVQLSTSQGR